VRNSAYRSQVRNTKSLLSWKITRSVVSLSSFRATLGQRKSLINSISQISKHQFSGKTTQTHYNGKKLNTPRRRPYAPNGLGGGSLSGLLPGRSDPTDADAGRTDVSVDPARRTARTPRGRSSRRRRQRPRRRPTALRLALQPLPRLQRRHDSATGRRSRFPTSSRRADRQTLQLLPPTATSTSADVPWLAVSSGGPTQHPAFSGQQRTGTAVPS